MSFRPEPPYVHGTPQKTGVLLVNLGSPDEATPAATRRYLREFLSDPRVVEIPPAVWWPILHGIILRTRPAKSAAKYATIWKPGLAPGHRNRPARPGRGQRPDSRWEALGG